MDNQSAKEISLILDSIFSGKSYDNSSILKDLGFDSIAQIEFIVAIEEKFKVVVEPERVKNWECISDIFEYFDV